MLWIESFPLLWKDFLVFVMSFPSVMKSHSVHLAVSFFFFHQFTWLSGPSQSENHVLEFWTVLWNIKKTDFCPLLEHILSWNGALMHWISNFLTFSLCFLLFLKQFYFLGYVLILSSNQCIEFPCLSSNFLPRALLKSQNFLFVTSCSRFIDETLFQPSTLIQGSQWQFLWWPSAPCAFCFPLISS